MPRINRDPTGDIPPSDAVIGAALPSDMTANQRSAALQSARAAWQAQHQAAVEAWNAQADSDAAVARQAEEDAAAERQRVEEARLAALREAEEADRIAQEAKRPKFDVDDSAQAPAFFELQVPSSALKDLREGRFVDWHLFTPELCLEDQDSYRHDPEYKLTETSDGSLVMRTARRATKTPIQPDKSLSYEQWSSGILSFLRTIKDVGWSEQVVDQWNSFFFQLGHHPARAKDPRAIVIYAAGIRADWHRERANGKKLFNVSLIHPARMQAALDEAKGWDLDAKMKAATAATQAAEAAAQAATAAVQALALRVPTPKATAPGSQKPYGRSGQSFRQDAASSAHRACVICLGRHAHNVAACASATLHGSDKKAACARRGGVLTNVTNNVAVCLIYNIKGACNGGKGHNGAHECSGCGKHGHSAQECPALSA
ncbi:hypothetical protein AURDEDRAFT_175406 [Auricularia subglabra TFB-10046 SS5]|nr:hypothetical protein AURDEDRAFT_175406 [Auricularia subglabra TFB-10046 SS5]